MKLLYDKTDGIIKAIYKPNHNEQSLLNVFSNVAVLELETNLRPEQVIYYKVNLDTLQLEKIF